MIKDFEITNMKVRGIVKLILIVVINFIIAMTFIGLSEKGIFTFGIEGFAIDKDNQLYIAKYKKIEIISNSEVIKTISPVADRGYRFTIKDGETIITISSRYIYTLDLEGKLLSKVESDWNLEKEFNISKSEFIAFNGVKYTKTDILGYYTISHIENGEKIIDYRVSLLEYGLGVALVVWWSYVALVIIRLIMKERFKVTRFRDMLKKIII